MGMSFGNDGVAMYYCENCHQTFEELDHYEENVGEYWGMPAYKTFDICPICGSDKIADCRMDCFDCEFADECEDKEE